MLKINQSHIAALEFFGLIALVYLIFEVPISNEITLLLLTLLIIILIMFVLLVRSVVSYGHYVKEEKNEI